MKDLSNLKPPAGAITKKKRRGRGEASGLGKTSGRGEKGQKARSGGSVRPRFEGGQTPMHRRLPKRGFRNKFAKQYTIVNLYELTEKFAAGETVDPESLLAKKVTGKIAKDGLKVLSDGELTVALTVKAHKASKRAIEKIQAAGGAFVQL